MLIAVAAQAYSSLLRLQST